MELDLQSILGVMSGSIIIMCLGFYLGKRGVVDSSLSKDLGEIVLGLSIPAVSFNAFMTDFKVELLKETSSIFIWSFLIHLFFIVIGGILYARYLPEKRVVLKMMSIFGGVTVFGIPIVKAIYGDIGIMYASVFCIPYRILLYSYGFIKMSGMKLDKKNLKNMLVNPVIIATILGVIIWLFQNLTPQIDISGKNYSIFRVDKTAIYIYKPLSFLASLCSPLAWLAAGLKLSEVSIGYALKDFTAWYFSLIKIIFVPILSILLVLIGKGIGILPISSVAIGVILIMMGTPTASVIIAYSLKYNREPVMASSSSFLATVLSVITIPILLILLSVTI